MQFGLDKRLIQSIVVSRLFHDGERFRVDTRVEGAWDLACWQHEDALRINEMHDNLVAITKEPLANPDVSMPTSLLILAQELSARRGIVVNIVHVKDSLYSSSANQAWRRARHKDPEIILYHDAGSHKVGAQFLQRRHLHSLCKAARSIENIDLDLAEKIANLKQESLIAQARQRYAMRETAANIGFQTTYMSTEADPMFIYMAMQGLDSFGASMQAVGGSLRFNLGSVAGAGRPSGTVFTDAGSIGDIFNGGSGDDAGAVIIIIIIAFIAFLVTAGIFVWVIQRAMTRAEQGDTSMTYYLNMKGKIHKYRAPRIYTDDLKSR